MNHNIIWVCRRSIPAAVLAFALAVSLLLLGTAAPAGAAFPGANGRIAFISWRTGSGDVYTMDANGLDLRNINPSDGSDANPAWSPDGTTIALQGGEALYLMDANGGNVRALGVWGAQPAWSPDGQRIAYTYAIGAEDEDIEVINVDGTGWQQLTFGNEREMAPSWSPDGTKIVYHRKVNGTNDEIYVMNADGANQTRLTYNDAQDYYPDWSPDGSRIVFVSTRNGDGRIFIMNADGTAPTLLTHDTDHETFPSWSPDGSRIVYTAYIGGSSNGDIYTINANGTDTKRLTSTIGPDDHADWQPLVSGNPVAIADYYSVYADRPLIEPAPGVLDNDTNPGGGVWEAILVADAGHGELELADDGSFSYVPSEGFIGLDTFSYQVSDGSHSSNTAVVSITVKSDFPVAVADDYSTMSDHGLEVSAPGVLDNDTDPEAQPLAAALVEDVSHGTLALTPDGAFTYMPDPGFVGHDGFTYQAFDGYRTSPPAPVTIDVRIFQDNRIVYTDEEGSIWVMNADGSSPVALTGTGPDRANPVWSPDGTHIAFDMSTEPTGEMQVYLMEADGANVTRLTTGTDTYNGRASWSPDGTKLVFESMRDENSEIYVIDATGGPVVNLTSNPAEDSFPDWSPDGSRIVFASDRNGDTELYTMDVDGSGVSLLTTKPGWDGDPRWSPDGTEIAFYDENADVWIVDTGGNLRNLTDTAASVEIQPAWSPDGTKLVFTFFEDLPGPDEPHQLQSINRDGSDRIQLTFDGGAHTEPDWWGPTDADDDGVDAPIEGNAPNNGDGNSDGVPDSRQADVTSLPNSAGTGYITLEGPNGSTFVDVSAIANPSPVDAPIEAEFPVGFIDFKVMLSTAGSATTVTLFLEGDITVSSYYKYGPTPDNPADHWYEFLYDGTTGAEILADRIVLHFVDGLRGDSDLTADGDIEDPGAPARRSLIYLSPAGTGKVGAGAGAITFTGADILTYMKATNTWDIFYDGSYVKTPKNVGAFAFVGRDIILGFSAAQVVPGSGTVAAQDLVRFTPTRTGYNNTAGTFAWFFDGSDVGLTTSAEAIDALWIDAAGRLYISTAGTAKVTGPGGGLITAHDEDVLRFTPTSTGANTAGTWELYWDPTSLTGMSAEDINGYWEDPDTGDRYTTILGAFTIGNAAYGGRFSGNGKTILRFTPNTAAPGGWAPVEKIAWLASGATFPSNLDGIEMTR